MSNLLIASAIESYAIALEPDFPTALENVNFAPPDGPFQAFYFLFAEPDDAGYRDSGYIQRGIFTVGLFYPTNEGAGDAQIKAEAFRDYFKRGTSIVVNDNIVVNVDRTPEITGGAVEDDRFVIRVRIRWYAHIDRA